MQSEGKKRIGIYLGNEPYNGGAFQYNQSILIALGELPAEKYEVVVFYVHDLWKDFLSGKSYILHKVRTRRELFDLGSILLHRTSKYLGFNLGNIRNVCAQISPFSKQFDSANLDLMIFPAQEMYSATIKTKSIAVIHDLMHRYEKFPEVVEYNEYIERECNYKAICESASMIFVDSEVGKKQVIDSYGEKYESKIAVMPFTPPHYLFEEDDDMVVDNINLPEKFIFYPAQFWSHKNHKNLLLAISKLKQKGIDVYLVLAGSKKNGYPEIMELINSQNLENNVAILGYVSDSLMRFLYKKARAMVMPTFFGPTNIPPLEGMAMGCPVAVSRRYAMPWQVADAGLTFNPDDVDEIATIIEQLWSDDNLCEKLIKKGKQRIKFFGQEKFNMRFKDAITNIL